VEIRKQIEHAQELGISGFVIDWYGDREPFLDRSYAIVQSVAAEKNFKVAMMYDESEGDVAAATDDALAAFEKFNQTYLAPNAAGRQAYLTYQDRPVIFIFPKDSSTDWNRVRQVTQSWPDAPVLIYKDLSAKYPNAFDGYYAWVQPGQNGWARDGSHYGEDYLEYFYKSMLMHHPDKIAVGAAWPGFDDSAAKWGLNRHMQSRCGQTLEDTLHLYTRYFDAAHRLPFVMIETWNDYEEGTAVERLSFAKCGQSTQSASGSR